MAVEVIEKIESRRFVSGMNPYAERIYVVSGTEDELEALRLVLANSPLSVYVDDLRYLPRSEPEIIPDGFEHWLAFVRYLPIPQVGDFTYAFETGGGSMRIKHARRHVSSYYPPNATNRPNHRGAIGVTSDGQIEGVDITIPQFTFSETHYLAKDAVTPAYKGILALLTGCVNTQMFRGLAPGEALFLGASGSKRSGQDDWEIVFRFAGSPNETNLTIGDEITGIEKRGWEYLWVEFELKEGSGALEHRPIAVHIEKVYREADLNALGI